MFSNGRNTLELRLTEIAEVRFVLMQRNNFNFPIFFNCKGGNFEILLV